MRGRIYLLFLKKKQKTRRRLRTRLFSPARGGHSREMVLLAASAAENDDDLRLRLKRERKSARIVDPSPQASHL
jgi:hypothetical protein